MLIKVIRPKGSTPAVRLVAGTTFEQGLPASRAVRAYSHKTGILLTQIQSGLDGRYKLYLPYDLAYTLVAIDSRKMFNAVIQDNVVPK